MGLKARQAATMASQGEQKQGALGNGEAGDGMQGEGTTLTNNFLCHFK